jgi:hypothetical protein
VAARVRGEGLPSIQRRLGRVAPRPQCHTATPHPASAAEDSAGCPVTRTKGRSLSLWLRSGKKQGGGGLPFHTRPARVRESTSRHVRQSLPSSPPPRCHVACARCPAPRSAAQTCGGRCGQCTVRKELELAVHKADHLQNELVLPQVIAILEDDAVLVLKPANKGVFSAVSGEYNQGVRRSERACTADVGRAGDRGRSAPVSFLDIKLWHVR